MQPTENRGFWFAKMRPIKKRPANFAGLLNTWFEKLLLHYFDVLNIIALRNLQHINCRLDIFSFQRNGVLTT